MIVFDLDVLSRETCHLAISFRPTVPVEQVEGTVDLEIEIERPAHRPFEVRVGVEEGIRG